MPRTPISQERTVLESIGHYASMPIVGFQKYIVNPKLKSVSWAADKLGLTDEDSYIAQAQKTDIGKNLKGAWDLMHNDPERYVKLRGSDALRKTPGKLLALPGDLTDGVRNLGHWITGYNIYDGSVSDWIYNKTTNAVDGAVHYTGSEFIAPENDAEEMVYGIDSTVLSLLGPGAILKGGKLIAGAVQGSHVLQGSKALTMAQQTATIVPRVKTPVYGAAFAGAVVGDGEELDGDIDIAPHTLQKNDIKIDTEPPNLSDKIQAFQMVADTSKPTQSSEKKAENGSFLDTIAQYAPWLAGIAFVLEKALPDDSLLKPFMNAATWIGGLTAAFNFVAPMTKGTALDVTKLPEKIANIFSIDHADPKLAHPPAAPTFSL